MIDVYVDELEKIDTDRTAPIEIILQPMQRMSIETDIKAVRLRATEVLQDESLCI